VQDSKEANVKKTSPLDNRHWSLAVPTNENKKKPEFIRFTEPLRLGPDCEMHVFKTDEEARAWILMVICGRDEEELSLGWDDISDLEDIVRLFKQIKSGE
jgi:hypothetical protein